MAITAAEKISVKFERRQFLRGSAYLAASFALPQSMPVPAMAAEALKSGGATTVEKSLPAFFSAKGYRTIAAKSLVTNRPEFNGGLRYDETGTVDMPGRMIVQPCARLSDISEKIRPDILPLFHIFRCNAHPGQNKADLFASSLAYLTGPLQLDPTRLAIVSIPPFAQIRATLPEAGVDWDRQIHLRDPDAALKAGDGSGIFRHPGPDYVPAMPTAGLYYRLDDGAGDPPKVHPLPAAWTEIGEFMMADNGTAFIAFGVERLHLASAGTIPSWNEQLPNLLNRIRQDAGNGALPSGAKTFSAS